MLSLLIFLLHLDGLQILRPALTVLFEAQRIPLLRFWHRLSWTTFFYESEFDVQRR